MKKLGWLLASGIVLMIVLSFLTVLMKSLFNYNSNALQDTILYLHACVFMLGIVYAYHFNKHVRIDIFYQKFSKNKQKKVDFYASLFLFFPFFAFIIYSGYSYVFASWEIMEKASDSGGLPFVYVLKTLILIVPLFMLILGVLKLVKRK